MAAMSDYLENKLVDHLLRATAYSAPATLYFALFTTATSDASTGTEVTGGSYARASLTSATTAWNATQGGTTGASSGTGGLSDNAAAITFTTASASWGTITHMAVMDAATGGNMLFQGALTTSKAVGSGDTFKFNAGDLNITFA